MSRGRGEAGDNGIADLVPEVSALHTFLVGLNPGGVKDSLVLAPKGFKGRHVGHQPVNLGDPFPMGGKGVVVSRGIDIDIQADVVVAKRVGPKFFGWHRIGRIDDHGGQATERVRNALYHRRIGDVGGEVGRNLVLDN